MWILNRTNNTVINSYAVSSIYVQDKSIFVRTIDGNSVAMAVYESKEDAEKAFDRYVKSPGGFIRRISAFPTSADLAEKENEYPDIIPDDDEEDDEDFPNPFS